MEKRNISDVLKSSCIYDLYRIPDDAKIFRLYHIYGDYEIIW